MSRLTDDIPKEDRTREPYKAGKTGIPAEDIQRWCIVRKYGQDEENPQLHIAVANASEILLAILSDESEFEKHFTSLKADRLEWWQDEDKRYKLSQSEFRAKLEKFSDYLEDKPVDEKLIEEGMVFLRIETQEPRFVHFTYQARNMSERVFSQLTGDVIEEQSPLESA